MNAHRPHDGVGRGVSCKRHVQPNIALHGDALRFGRKVPHPCAGRGEKANRDHALSTVVKHRAAVSCRGVERRKLRRSDGRWGLIAVALDDPSLDVGRLECVKGQPQLLDGGEATDPQQVLLQGPDEPLGTAVALGLTDEGGRARDDEESQLTLVIVGDELAPVVVVSPPATPSAKAPKQARTPRPPERQAPATPAPDPRLVAAGASRSACAWPTCGGVAMALARLRQHVGRRSAGPVPRVVVSIIATSSCASSKRAIAQPDQGCPSGCSRAADAPPPGRGSASGSA